MSETEPPHDGIHPEVLLLPWFLSGTLEVAERKQVTAHLAQCAACRTELESLTVLRRLLRDSFAEAQWDRAAESPRAPSRTAALAWLTRRGWGLLAACLIGVQLAVIVRLWTAPHVPAQLITRELAPASPQLRCTPSDDGPPGAGH